MTGFVSLIGAGPGDPELLTLKAAQRLREADLVLHDALVSPEILALAAGAKAFDVGKRARRKSTPQETIHRIMIQAARRGQRVARLKGGDPFVLGRGGEEALALAAAGVPFEVIPGVSSAVAAPALAGIPVTHRGLTSGFMVLSGHAAESYRPLLEALAPNSVTLVVLMGVANRGGLAEFLIRCGWRAETPAALIFGASTAESTTWVSSLEELDQIPVPPANPPGTLVIGDVVSLADRIAIGDPMLVALEKGVPA
jgi:uroporphyrin-III C-methyltransferase/precorrin-2 dehydrogenase/sirohydrochlorin ferrochelatase